MSSSFPKHFCFHRFVSFLCALLIAGSLVVILRKDCRALPLPSDDKLWPTFNTNNSFVEHFVSHFYDKIEIYHIVVISADVILFLLAFINIAPAQEDLRFGFHLLVIIILGGITLLTSYMAYIAFHQPCHSQFRSTGDAKQHTANSINPSRPQVYPHNTKDKNPVNAYVEEDMLMLAVTGMDTLAALLFFLSTVILCVDAREEAIQDEYVARVRASIY